MRRLPLTLERGRGGGGGADGASLAAAQAPSLKRGSAGPGAISLNLSNLAKEHAPSELQQRRQKFAYFEKRCSPVRLHSRG